MKKEINEVLTLVEEFQTEDKKTEKIYPTYKYRGEIRTRSYPDHIYTERYKELYELIRSRRVFKCRECGQMHHYWGLERWMCDFDNDDFICSSCYEEYMGDDL